MRNRKRKNWLLISALFLMSLKMPVFSQTGKKTDVIKQYSICNFTDGLKIRDTRRLDADTLRSRAVETKDGEKEVTRIESFYVLVGYPKMSPFANIRPERSQLVKDLFESDKKNVVENLRYTIAQSREMATDEPAKSSVNGFEVYQIHRKTLFGSTLGITVMFNDADNTITTIYLFNAEEKKRNFQTVEEWLKLRDNFLNNYTQCINANLGR